MRYTLLLIVALCFYLQPNAQVPDFNWDTYDTSTAIDLKGFSTLTKLENDFINSVSDFKDNRARLTLKDSGNHISPKELQTPDFPLPCMCFMKDDTVFISATLGFMSGLGIITAIHKENFATSFFHYADGADVFKHKKSDTSYTDNISVSALSQRLTLLNKPSRVNNEIITGTLISRFNTFYELESNEAPLVRKYSARLFFKCRLRVVSE